MATNTKNFKFKKPDESDFYDVQDQNGNWDMADEELEKLNAPTFEDYSGGTFLPEASSAIDGIKSGFSLPTLLSNIKAAFKGACLLGHIVNNCVTNRSDLPLSAAQGKALMDMLTKLNGERFSVPESYFRDNINKTYSSVEVLIFGYLVIMRISILIDNFTDYFGEVTDDIRRIPALKELAPKEIRAPGIIRSADNTKTQGHIGSLMYDGNSGKIYANIYACGTETRPASVTSGYVIGQLITYLKW